MVSDICAQVVPPLSVIAEGRTEVLDTVKVELVGFVVGVSVGVLVGVAVAVEVLVAVGLAVGVGFFLPLPTAMTWRVPEVRVVARVGLEAFVVCTVDFALALIPVLVLAARPGKAPTLSTAGARSSEIIVMRALERRE